jgi:hypothetical protein
MTAGNDCGQAGVPCCSGLSCVHHHPWSGGSWWECQ